ncbi:hypothetical protein NMY22_g7525 [Coprinellus aureogranulatus]|nr:hypothetical protein NMY22_g7525 [Coprinellus aureogranulatus]
MAQAHRMFLNLLPLHLVLLLACSILPVDGGHHEPHPIARLLHRRQSSTSVGALPGQKGTLHLDDSVFRPTKAMSDPHWSYGSAPDGKRSMIARYPKGSWNFKQSPRGGFSFYAPGTISLKNAKEVTFGYSVWFPKGFEFQKGGKLPGIYGGDNNDVATGCSGGRRDNRCFSARLMWRKEGAGEFYTYLPPDEQANKAICGLPNSECNDTYGASVRRGSFTWATGAWTTVSMRVRLNDDGKENGQLQLWANGQTVVNVKGLVLATSKQGRMQGMQFQTFFGGSDSTWATPKDQEVFFSDFTLAVTAEF